MNNFPTLNTQNTDDRPLPEIIAAGEGFTLAYHDRDGKRYYAVQDWLIGVAQTDNPRDFWQKLKARAKRAGLELSPRCLQLPYKSSNGKTYRLDHADAETLYLITQRMDVNTGIRGKVLAYLAKAGVFVDQARVDPESAVESIESARRAKWERDGRDSAWIANRQNGIYTRKQLTAEIQRILGTGEHMGKLTNTTYRGVLGTDAAGLRERLGLHPGQNPRDYLATLSLYYIGAAEEGARLILSRYQDDDVVSFEDVRKVIEVVSRASGIAAADMAAIVGVDLITGERLLPPPGEQE